jgi:hypothetical protein
LGDAGTACPLEPGPERDGVGKDGHKLRATKRRGEPGGDVGIRIVRFA